MGSRLTVIMLAASLCALAGASEEGKDHDLIANMGALQYFSHKLDLSIRYKNRELVDFYVHEIEETLEATTEIEEYHGKPVGELAGSMLLPAFERFDQALDAEDSDWEDSDWSAIDGKFGELIDACNACHQATDYGFIRIERTRSNPFMQSFAPK